MILRTALILFLLLLGLLNPVTNNKLDLAVGVFVALFCLLYVFGFVPGFIKRYGIFVVIVTFLFSAIVIGGPLRTFLSRDLPLGNYNNDPGVIYKTHLLLKQDFGYYDAFAAAQLGRFGQPSVPGDIWGWRTPTLFQIWYWLPGKTGLPIYILYLVLASVTMLVSYLLAKRYIGEKLAILSPYLMFAYLHFGARDQMVLETEWWAVLLFILGLYFLITKKFFGAIILLSATVLVRELYILPIGLMFLASLFFKPRYVPIFLTPLAAFAVLFYFHILWVNSYIDALGTLFAPRVIENGLFFVQQTLAFASWEYLLFAYRPFAILLVLATFGCIALLVKRQTRLEGLFLLVTTISFPIAFLRFGTIPFNDYWGVTYMPVVLSLAPLSALIFKRK